MDLTLICFFRHQQNITSKMKFVLVAALLAWLVASAVAQDYPLDIGICGEGTCKAVPVLRDEFDQVVGVGPVTKTLEPGLPGSYPMTIALCGRGTCVTVPVVFSDESIETAQHVDGVTPSGDWPDSIGLCGFGMCRNVPVLKDEFGTAIGIGPVEVVTGEEGGYPLSVGVCGRGVCLDLPVVPFDNEPDTVVEVVPDGGDIVTDDVNGAADVVVYDDDYGAADIVTDDVTDGFEAGGFDAGVPINGGRKMMK